MSSSASLDLHVPSLQSTGSTSRPIEHDALDRGLIALDAALRTLWGRHVATRPCPQPGLAEDGWQGELGEAEKRHAAALMRVNHVGEVCAQALYAAQAWGTHSPALKAHFEEAAREETDHLAWTEQRLAELGGRTSWLNPLWFTGALALGYLAAKAGDPISLGFVAETEKQVGEHLASHLDHLPEGDAASRAIVTQMRDDELAHANAALEAGGVALPAPVRGLMRVAAKVMTTVAHRL